MPPDGLVVATSGAAISPSPVAAGVDEGLRATMPVACAEPTACGLHREDRQAARGDRLGPRDSIIVIGREVEMGLHPVMGTQKGP